MAGRTVDPAAGRPWTSAEVATALGVHVPAKRKFKSVVTDSRHPIANSLFIALKGEMGYPSALTAKTWGFQDALYKGKPVTLARKILSCVARVGQRFGSTHVANVLRGHRSEQVAARGHDRLTTFSLLPDASVAELRGYIEQLCGGGFLQQTDDAYPVLALTPRGLRLLKDESSAPGLRLARQRVPRREEPRRRSRVEAESWEGVDRDLFDRLRAVRLDVARERGVPPYVIFHDATLREMARLRPTSVPALLHVKGVGARKAEDLGDLFLEVIRRTG
jgi:ATP-dependent DNA helicase RecQ